MIPSRQFLRLYFATGAVQAEIESQSILFTGQMKVTMMVTFCHQLNSFFASSLEGISQTVEA
jgi:hypothetical protein